MKELQYLYVGLVLLRYCKEMWYGNPFGEKQDYLKLNPLSF